MQLSETQRQLIMLMTQGYAWTTSRVRNVNLDMLEEWQSKGWVKECPSPADSLIAFQATEEGIPELEKIANG